VCGGKHRKRQSLWLTFCVTALSHIFPVPGVFLGGGFECTAHVGCGYCVLGMNVCVCVCVCVCARAR
jgi:hypothetical protein